eukprot:11167882-Lingulodinium_polyedra.AAC.1
MVRNQRQEGPRVAGLLPVAHANYARRTRLDPDGERLHLPPRALGPRPGRRTLPRSRARVLRPVGNAVPWHIPEERDGH